jgi:hypothetical protein
MSWIAMESILITVRNTLVLQAETAFMLCLVANALEAEDIEHENMIDYYDPVRQLTQTDSQETEN